MAVGDDSSVPDWLKRFSFLKQTSISRTDMFLLGITGIITQQIVSWNNAAEGSFKEFIASAIFPTIGYIILTCCVAEMASALPFSGGIYGFVRAFTTPVVGFFVAVFEMSFFTCAVRINVVVVHLIELFSNLLGGIIHFIVRWEGILDCK